MDKDRLLLDKAIEQPSYPILRFYRFSEPSITIGFHQKLETLKSELAQEDKIPIVRRPTGGRAILHSDELTYSVIIPKTHPITSLSITQSYGLISAALLNGLRFLGIDAAFLPGDRGYINSASCFASSSRYEIAAGGKKFIGSAQKRDKGALLQQGSILTGSGYKNIEKYTNRHTADKGTSISEILGNIPRRLELEYALTKGFQEVLDCSFIIL